MVINKITTIHSGIIWGDGRAFPATNTADV